MYFSVPIMKPSKSITKEVEILQEIADTPITQDNFLARIILFLKTRNITIKDSVFSYIFQETGCSVKSDDFKKLSIIINTDQISFESFETSYLIPLFDAFATHGGIPQKKHEISICFIYQRSVSIEKLYSLLKKYGPQIIELKFLWYPPIDDSLLNKIINRCRNLKCLVISSTKGITEKSIKNLSKLSLLETLRLEGCRNLHELPPIKNGRLKTLEILTCESLKRVSFRNLEALEEIFFVYCNACRWVSFSDLKNLSELTIDACKELEEIIFFKTPSIKKLNFRNLSSIKKIKGFKTLQTLEEFNISGSYLKKISMESFENIKSIIIDSSNIKKIRFYNLINLETLCICSDKLEKLELFDLKALKKLELSSTYILKKLLLPELPELITIKILFCSSLKEITGLSNLLKVESLEFYSCRQLEKLKIKNMPNLNEIRLCLNYNLRKITLEDVNKLQNLFISSCEVLKKIIGLSRMPEIQTIKIAKCNNLQIDLSQFLIPRNLNIYIHVNNDPLGCYSKLIP